MNLGWLDLAALTVGPVMLLATMAGLAAWAKWRFRLAQEHFYGEERVEAANRLATRRREMAESETAAAELLKRVLGDTEVPAQGHFLASAEAEALVRAVVRYDQAHRAEQERKLAEATRKVG